MTTRRQRARCTAITFSRHRGGRCRNWALAGDTLCRVHGGGAGRPSPYGRTREGLVSVESLWYRADRVCAHVTAYSSDTELTGWLTGASAPDSWTRRWYAWRCGAEPWIRLTMVDRLFTYLGLPLALLGDPDVASSLPPGYAERLGYLLTPYGPEMELQDAC